MEKVFKSIDEMLEILKSRGMEIDDDKARAILEEENYYSLINGYKKLFIDTTYVGPDEKYKEGTCFDEIYALYQFDGELRNIFLSYILKIENHVKSILSHKFSEKYGHDNYLKIDNFDTTLSSGERNKTRAQKIGEISEIIATIQKDIATQLSKNNPMISHSMLEYGYVPFWILINTLTLGKISTFYQHMKQEDQNDVGRNFRLQPHEMKSILFVLSLFRNACAHNERLYNFKAYKRNRTPNDIKTCRIHNDLNIPTNDRDRLIYGKNDLFAAVIIIKLMMKRTSFNDFFEKVKSEINTLEGQLQTIPITEILQAMGFPPNWMDIKDL